MVGFMVVTEGSLCRHVGCGAFGLYGFAVRGTGICDVVLFGRGLYGSRTLFACCLCLLGKSFRVIVFPSWQSLCCMILVV